MTEGPWHVSHRETDPTGPWYWKGKGKGIAYLQYWGIGPQIPTLFVSVTERATRLSRQPKPNSHVESLEKQLHLAQTGAFTRHGRQVGHLYHKPPAEIQSRLGLNTLVSS